MILDKLLTGKIRVKLLTKLILNPDNKVYLRGLERDLGVSSNTVRLELNKLTDLQLIHLNEEDSNAKVKHYSINIHHPLFSSLRGIILKYVGIDQILEQVIHKLGNVQKVYLTGDLAQGKNCSFVDLVVVGDIDRDYLHKLIDKVEPMIDKKIRVAVFSISEFREEYLKDVGSTINLLEE